jgi:hypothetical protein
MVVVFVIFPPYAQWFQNSQSHAHLPDAHSELNRQNCPESCSPQLNHTHEFSQHCEPNTHPSPWTLKPSSVEPSQSSSMPLHVSVRGDPGVQVFVSTPFLQTLCPVEAHAPVPQVVGLAM